MKGPSYKLWKDTCSEIMLYKNLYLKLDGNELLFIDTCWQSDIEHEVCVSYAFILAQMVGRKVNCKLPSRTPYYQLSYIGFIQNAKEDLLL